VQDLRAVLSEASGAQWLAIGAGMVIAPVETMKLAGLDVEGTPARIVARVLGLRDIALGAAMLSVTDPDVRRRLLRAVAATTAGEFAVIFAFRGERPARAAVRLAVVNLGSTVQALVASTSDAELPSAGVLPLAAGYLLSVAPTLQLGPVLRERRMGAFAAFEAGCALLSMGWLQRKQPLGAAVNGSAGAAVGALMLRAWWKAQG